MTEEDYLQFLNDRHEHAKITLTNLLTELAPASVVDYVKDFVDAEGLSEDDIGFPFIG